MNEDDATITAAGALLRRYHDVAVSFIAPRDAQWRTVAPGRHEIICHYDWAPYNALFRGHEPVVMLDWDSAGPGTRLWDVALAAYQWVPLFPILDGVSHNRVLPLPQRAARLATFCQGYGGVRPAEAIDALVEELPFHAELIQRLADEGDPGSVKLVGWNVPERVRRESELLRRERSSLVGT
jgi:Ser/Thr protein kinase RdoA (MazF antagonist)